MLLDTEIRKCTITVCSQNSLSFCSPHRAEIAPRKYENGNEREEEERIKPERGRRKKQSIGTRKKNIVREASKKSENLVLCR